MSSVFKMSGVRNEDEQRSKCFCLEFPTRQLAAQLCVDAQKAGFHRVTGCLTVFNICCSLAK